MKNKNQFCAELLNEFSPLDGKTICVAFSGGADSVCLLHFLNSLRNNLGFNLFAAHVNHNLRGEEAKRDAVFCENFCNEIGLDFKLLDIDVLSLKPKGESIEEAARRLRYAALNSLKFDLLATAHHLDDNTETVIINLLRGTGLKGLCGIPAKRDNIIRPLLNISKDEILNYCKENNLSFVTDSTNNEDDCTRNVIRHKVTPVFKRINPSFLAVFKRSVALLKEDEDFLTLTANSLFNEAYSVKGLKIGVISNAHYAILTRLIIKYCKLTANLTPDTFHVDKFIDIILGKISGYEFCDGYFAKVKNGYFCLEKQEVSDYKVNFEVVTKKKYQNLLKINKLLLKNAVDYDKIVGELNIRNRAAGDKLRIKDRGVSKTVRRLQQELYISANLRDKMPLAADNNGVFWGYLIGTDERVSIDENSKNILIFEVFEN